MFYKKFSIIIRIIRNSASVLISINFSEHTRFKILLLLINLIKMSATGSKDTIFSKNLSINLRGKLMHFNLPKLMGILNVTPDSFYDGGRNTSMERISAKVAEMIREGADIIDIGGYSTRPGAKEISEKEELTRLRSAVELIKSSYSDFPVSIDTFRSGVAEIMIRDYEADMINDVTAGDGDPRMADIVAKYRIPYVIMHMQGNPRTMQKNPCYEDIVNDLLKFFAKKIYLLKEKGIIDYIVDPGFGFGKTLDHNYTLLNQLHSFRILEAPLMVGLSRKSMIYKLLDTDAGHALNGSTALHMAALMNGADILRVHDIKEASETIKLFTKMHEQ